MGYKSRRFSRGRRYSKRISRKGGAPKKPSGSSYEKKKVAAEKKVVAAQKAFSTAEKAIATIADRLDKNTKDGDALRAKLLEAQPKLAQLSAKVQEAESALQVVNSALEQYRQARHFSPKVVKLTRRHSK